MSRDKVVTTMIANFKSIDNGRQTQVTAPVERGNAPDDFVAPAFRSYGITLACSRWQWKAISTISPIKRLPTQ
jgi:hypothetical protein